MGRPPKEKTGIKDLEILKKLALRGPLNCYEVSRDKKKVEIEYPTVWRRLVNDEDSLFRGGLVSVIPNSEPKKYTLTALGLLKLLSHYSENLKGCMDQIIERWAPLLPPLFKKWGYLKDRHLENDLIQILKRLRELVINPVFLSASERKDFLLKTNVRMTFFSMLFGFIEETTLAWYKAIRDEPELKQWAINNIKDEMNGIRTWEEVYEELLLTIEAQKEPNIDDLKKIRRKALRPYTPYYVTAPFITAQMLELIDALPPKEKAQNAS